MRIEDIIKKVFALFLFGLVAQNAGAQNKYYPDGTKWEFIKCWGINPMSATSIEDFLTAEQVISGDTILYNIRTKQGIVDSIRCKSMTLTYYDYYHQFVAEYKIPFIESGDSIYNFVGPTAHLIYDFSEWYVGKDLPFGHIFSLSKIELEDGNVYDYWNDDYRNTQIRTIGSTINWIIGHSLPRNGNWHLSYFIRNGVLIYRNDTIPCPEGYITGLSKIYPTDTEDNNMIFSLQGIPMGAKEQLPPGIYIRNRKLFFVK